MKYYENAKSKYENTTPIRGKAHIRPLCNRRKHHETVELFNEQEQIYSYKLYDTHIVLFYPNGDIGVNINHKGHHTQTTCKFIVDAMRGVFSAFINNNRMWVSSVSRVKQAAYPMPDRGETRFRQTEDGWRPTAPVMAQKKVVNRQRAKEARDPYREFIKLGKTILTLSEGWIMPETKAQYQKYEMCNRYSGPNVASFSLSRLYSTKWTKMLDYIQADPLEVLVHVVDHMDNVIYTDVSFDNGIAYAMKVTPKQFEAHVMRLIDRASDIHDYIDVEATGEFVRSYV